jgi:hypothetical protein
MDTERTMISSTHQASPDRLNSMEYEAYYLLNMVNEIVHNIPEAETCFAGWREELNTLIRSPNLETVAGEGELDELSFRLRLIWMKIAHSHSDVNFKSPLHETKIKFPMGRISTCDYERVISPKNLEARCEAYRPTPRGWRSRHLIFRSCMAAMTSCFQNIRPWLFDHDHEPIACDFFGGYYETDLIFNLFSSPQISFRHHATQSDFFNAVETGEGQIIFFEPVTYDWEMAALDFEKFFAALALRKNLPRMIIVDTTIVVDRFPLKKFLSDLPGKPPPILMQISSGLKLDQEGLEFANVGIVSLFWSKLETEQKSAALTFIRKMRSNRKITGAGHSVDEIALLDVPWFLNPERFSDHCASIFEHNRELATVLSPIVDASKGIFSHVSHPSLTDSAHFRWAVSPFVVFHFREEVDSKASHKRLIALLLKESREKNLGLRSGTSFGFRGHRFEIVQPNSLFHPNGRQKGVLKVAMGRRSGPSKDEIIRSLIEIANSEKIVDCL